MKTINVQITQSQMARLAGCDPAFLNKIIHRKRPCPTNLAETLEKVSGVDRKIWVWGTKAQLHAALGYAPPKERRGGRDRRNGSERRRA